VHVVAHTINKYWAYSYGQKT